MYVVSQRQIVIYENIGMLSNFYAINRDEKGVMFERSVDCNSQG